MKLYFQNYFQNLVRLCLSNIPQTQVAVDSPCGLDHHVMKYLRSVLKVIFGLK